MVSKIDFYHIHEVTQDNVFRFACRVVEKAFLKEHQVYIHLDNATDAHQMDSILWTFRDVSFVPHYLVSENQEAPVLIGFGEVPNIEKDVLINLSSEVPPFFGQFQRVLEIVSENPTQKSKAREHYRQYQTNGLKIDMCKID